MSKKHPKRTRARSTFHEAGKHASVSEDMAEFVKRASHPTKLMRRAHQLEDAGYLREANELFSATATKFSGNSMAWFQTARTHYDLTEMPQAFEAIEKSLKITPDVIGSLNLRSKIEKHLNQSMAATPESYMEQAQTLRLSGAKSANLRLLQQATTEFDQHGPLWAELGRSYLFNGMSKEAVSACDKALGIDENNRSAIATRKLAIGLAPAVPTGNPRCG